MPPSLQLNPQQLAAVMHGEGPLLIFAGAGSGKTRVLTMRVAHLIGPRRVPPWNILAVTFTNKAANEMRERIAALVGVDPAVRGSLRGIWVGTFHAICSLLLRMHGERIGIPKNFVVFDAGDSESLIRDCLRELNIDDNRYRPAGIANSISSAKNELVTPRQFQQNVKTPFESIVARVYDRYQSKLLANKALDFDDLLMRAVDLLREDAETRDRYQERFHHVLVDEYQDINFAQYRFVELIARKHRNLCVVGDDDQSIYRWRGADVRLILEFEKDYPDARIVKLEQNYRSTQPILDAAYQVIRRNVNRAEKRLWTEQAEGEKILIHDAADATEEAWFVAQSIQRLSGERLAVSSTGGTTHHSPLTAHQRWRDFAILCRTNAQSRVFEETFAQLRMPLRLVGAQRFYERKEIRDLVAYLRILANPSDEVSVRRIINTPPRGIGDRTIARLQQEAQRRGWSMMDVMRAPGRDQFLDKRAAGAVKDFVELYDRLVHLAEAATVTEIVQAVLAETGYIRALENERTVEAASRIENIQEFLATTKQFDESSDAWRTTSDETAEDSALATRHLSLVDFLERTALISDLDAWNEKDNAVTMMTIHSAKGLEFPIVFIVGMEEGLFPHSRSLNSGDAADIEEERRLCYVALTRAKDRVFLSYAHRRTLQGMTTSQLPSRFLDEIPSNLRTQRNEIGWRARETEWASSWNSAMSRRSTPARGADLRNVVSASESRPATVVKRNHSDASYRIGDKVRHGTWGEGLVIKVSREGDKDRWVEVAFPKSSVGIKKLMLDFAPLERV